MPLYNHSGEPLPLLSEADKLELTRFSGIYWERDKEFILHMTPANLKRWIHTLNPREALILTSTHGIRVKIQAQLNCSRFKMIIDFLWRIFH